MDWILVGALTALLMAVGTALLLRSVHDRREIAELRRHVDVFSEASIRVADTLDVLLRGDVEPQRTSQASRRYIVGQALEGMRGGEQLAHVAERLGLSHDEVALLQTAARRAA